MNNNLEVFNKIRSDLTTLAGSYVDLKINGVDDVDGYLKARDGAKELRNAEIELEKIAKSEREGALAYQRGVISLEKELLAITEPVKNSLKHQIEAIDKQKAREERRVLLADRLGKLSEIEVSLTDDEILDLDEKQWAEFYSQRKLNYLEDKDRERLDKERADKAEADRIENERIRQENEKLRADNKIIDDENKRLAQEKKDKDEADEREALRILEEEADRKAKMKGEKYDAFLKECGITEETAKDEFIINDQQLPDGTARVTVYKKVNSIIL